MGQIDDMVIDYYKIKNPEDFNIRTFLEKHLEPQKKAEERENDIICEKCKKHFPNKDNISREKMDKYHWICAKCWLQESQKKAEVCKHEWQYRPEREGKYCMKCKTKFQVIAWQWTYTRLPEPQQEDKKIGRLKFNWDMPSDWVISKINEIIDRLNPLL